MAPERRPKVFDPEMELGTDRTAWEGPEESPVFRVAQLALLLATAEESDIAITNLDRLAYFDFFAANPFIMLDGESAKKDTNDRLTLRLAGFTDGQVTYGSIGHRFTTRRERIRHDLALLVGRGLAQVLADRYAVTPAGAEFANELRTVHADAYRSAARIVFKRFNGLSEARLRTKAEKLLGKHWLLIDFLADVTSADTTPGGVATT